MGDYMIVRQADAHAWTEVWLADRGWYRIDPTAAVAPQRIDEGRYGAMLDGIGASWGLNAPSEWLYQMTMTWDAMNTKWNEWILAYGPDNQGRFMEWLGMKDPDWRKMMLTLVIVLAALISIISILLVLRYRPPAKDKAARLYQQFTKVTGISPERGETPLDYAMRISEQRRDFSLPAQRITELYLDARYGTAEAASMQQLQAAVSEFSRRS